MIFESVRKLIGLDLSVESIDLESSFLSYQQMAAIEKALSKLRSLPSGWDGYRGKAVTDVVSRRVHALLAKIMLPNGRYPSLVPGANGDIQIEWHSYGVDLEIEVHERGPARVYLKLADLEEEFEILMN